MNSLLAFVVALLGAKVCASVQGKVSIEKHIGSKRRGRMTEAKAETEVWSMKFIVKEQHMQTALFAEDEETFSLVC